MNICTVDFVRRGREYRLADWARDAGASVRPAEVQAVCWECKRSIRAGSRYIRLGVGDINLHPGCGIKQGALEFLDGPMKALIAKVAW